MYCARLDGQLEFGQFVTCITYCPFCAATQYRVCPYFVYPSTENISAHKKKYEVIYLPDTGRYYGDSAKKLERAGILSES